MVSRNGDRLQGRLFTPSLREKFEEIGSIEVRRCGNFEVCGNVMTRKLAKSY